MNERVPSVVHLIKTDNRPVARFLFLNILSILHNLHPSSIRLHVASPPHGFFWNLTLRYAPAAKIVVEQISTPILLDGREPHFRREWEDAHKSDIIRMNVLKSSGGIYMDTDVLVLRSFDPLRRYDFTMGLQTSTKMCNGVLLAHPRSAFLAAWHARMAEANFTTCWDCHSIELPSRIWAEQKARVATNASAAASPAPDVPNILPLEAFYDPSFSRSDLHELFREQALKKRLVPPYEGKFAAHLWNRVWVATKVTIHQTRTSTLVLLCAPSQPVLRLPLPPFHHSSFHPSPVPLQPPPRRCVRLHLHVQRDAALRAPRLHLPAGPVPLTRLSPCLPSAGVCN